MKSKILVIFLLLFISFSVQAEPGSIEIGYPVVDEMEARVLGSIYPKENIYQRLNRLETRVFGNITNASLSDRVDKLKDTVLGVKPEPVEEYSQPDIMPNLMFSENPQSPEEYKIILYELEKKLLGSVYITEPMDTRVARLENRVFSQSSDSYPIDERLQRLCAYADAKDSNDYYDDQAQLRQYSNVSNGVRALSILLMLLGAFL